jgi:hypothetical protein
MPIRRSPFVHQHPDYILEAIFAGNSRPELIHYRRHIAGAKRERSEGRIDGDIKLPASSINVTAHRLPPSQQYKRARTHANAGNRRNDDARTRAFDLDFHV